MDDIHKATDHYSSGLLIERIYAALREDGIDPDALSVERLAAFDQFHGRGIEATVELADQLDVSPSDHLLDVGSGIGGPARYMAHRFGCRVTGLDLTPEFCDVAGHLTKKLKLGDLVSIRQGNATAMPFDVAAFDGAYSMNVSMNICDKKGFYSEIFRVLKPGGWFALLEIAKGRGEGLEYPTPWARTADTSCLSTPEETAADLAAAGFTITETRDTRAAFIEYGVRFRDVVERGGKPLQRAVNLIHGELAETVTANSALAMREGAILPLEIMCRKV